MVRRLRRTPAWAIAQSLQWAVARPVCAGIHAAVTRLGPDSVPDDLALKHIYDYRTVQIDPRLIRRMVRVGDWYRVEPDASVRRSRLRQWYVIGGGWKDARRQVTRNLHGRFVADGAWDQRTKPFGIRATVSELFEEGRAPEETAEYRRLCEWVRAGDYLWTRGCMSKQDIDAYFARLIRVYEDIRENGYRTQAELGVDGADEIRVCIDRHGQPCVFGGGTHRLSIAMLLEIERVPVIVKRVHARWARESVERFGGPLRSAVTRGLAELETARAPGPDNRSAHALGTTSRQADATRMSAQGAEASQSN